VKKIFVFSLILMSLYSCSLFKKNADIEEHFLVAILDDLNNYRQKDSYKIVNAFVDEHVLNIDVTYSGGCNEHTFKLIGSNKIIEDKPNKMKVLLIHDANGDTCRELIGERLKFKIHELAFEGKDVLLMLEGYPNELYYNPNQIKRSSN